MNNSKFGIKNILKLTLPTIIMMNFMSLYTMIDGAFVSKFVSTDALSAVNIVYPFINFILGISIMLSSGGCALVMKKIGEGDETNAKKDFSLIIVFTFIVGIIITIFSFIFIDNIINFLGSTEILYQYCKDYLFYAIIFIIPTLLKFIFEQFLVAINKPNLALILSVLGGILNIILDYIFIVELNAGIKGAAIATGIGYSIPAIISFFIFFSKKNILHYKAPSKDFKIILKSCSNGSSEMISQLSSGIITFLFNWSMLRLLGEDGVAAITIVLYIQFLVTSTFIGYSIGIAPKISFYYGNSDTPMLKKIIGLSLKFIFTLSILIYIFIIIFSPVFILFFTEKGTSVFDITLNGLKIYSLSFILTGTNIFMSGMFTAFSNGLVSGIISFMRSLIFESLGIIVLPIFLGLIGLWFAVPLADLLGLFISVAFYFKYKKIYKY